MADINKYNCRRCGEIQSRSQMAKSTHYPPIIKEENCFKCGAVMFENGAQNNRNSEAEHPFKNIDVETFKREVLNSAKFKDIETFRCEVLNSTKFKQEYLGKFFVSSCAVTASGVSCPEKAVETVEIDGAKIQLCKACLSAYRSGEYRRIGFSIKNGVNLEVRL